jgi:hypothetical protein
MVIYLPAQSVDEEPMLDELTPREIVRELDKHVVGQPLPPASTTPQRLPRGVPNVTAVS